METGGPGLDPDPLTRSRKTACKESRYIAINNRSPWALPPKIAGHALAIFLAVSNIVAAS